MDKLVQYRIDGMPLDKASSFFADEILSQPGVKNVVILPDSFTKEKYLVAKNKVTIPSSIAITSSIDNFYPLFRSRGINCGMSLVALPIDKRDLDDKFLQSLFDKINYSIAYYINYRLRLSFIKNKYDLSSADFFGVLEKGAPYFADKFSLQNIGLENIEFGGQFKEINLKEQRKYLNDSWLDKRSIRLKNSFGRYFGGNHFLEIQEVVSSEESLGLHVGQLVVMFHTAGESLEDVIAPNIREKYINQTEYKSINSSDEDFKYFSTALAVLMNFGFAYRLATAAIIDDLVKDSFGSDKQAKIIIDRSHNHFIEENINNQKIIAYRHNAERLLPGGMSILSGDRNHPSYILKAGNSIDKTFYTIDHGLGSIIDYQKDLAEVNKKNNVKIYRFKKGLKNSSFHTKFEEDLIYNNIVDKYFSLMSQEDIAHKIAEFKPLINIKFT